MSDLSQLVPHPRLWGIEKKLNKTVCLSRSEVAVAWTQEVPVCNDTSASLHSSEGVGECQP